MISKDSDKQESRWQILLDDLTKIAIDNGILFNVKEAKNNADKIKLCYDNPPVRDKLLAWVRDMVDRQTFCKNADISNQYRLKGNKVYAGNKPEKATDLYTKALFYAPQDSDEVGLCYGNRSAVLQFLGRHKECVKDIDRALEVKNDDRLRRVRLLVRKVKSCNALRNNNGARESLIIARQIIHDAPQMDSKLSKLSLEVEEMNSKLLPARNDMGESYKIDERSSEAILRQFRSEFVPNLTFSGASNAISLNESLEKGRHVVASRDIEVGEIIFLDEPFAFICLPDPSYPNCHFCCCKTAAPIPCFSCADGSYCSTNCRDKAWQLFHRWECGAGVELCYNAGIAHLGLRVALVGLTADRDKYELVKGLVNHVDDLHPEDLFQYTATATALVIYLEEFTEFFSCTKQNVWEYGGTILLHIAQLVCNGNAITEWHLKNDEGPFGVVEEQQVRIGTAIYPSTSMMNHSCDPNIISSYQDNCIVVKATRIIPKGTEVFNSYGPNFRRQPTSVRQEILSNQYFFKCCCEPCQSPRDFLDKFIGSPCRNCDSTIMYKSLQCTQCKEYLPVSFQQDVDKADVLFQQAKDSVRLGYYERAIEGAEEALKYFTKHFYKNNREVLECKDLIARSCACNGQFKKSGRLIEECIEGARELYGSVSIEMVGEIIKLTDVVIQMMKRRNPDRDLFERSKKLAEEADNIVKVLYSVYHPRYEELKINIRSFGDFKCC